MHPKVRSCRVSCRQSRNLVVHCTRGELPGYVVESILDSCHNPGDASCSVFGDSVRAPGSRIDPGTQRIHRHRHETSVTGTHTAWSALITNSGASCRRECVMNRCRAMGVCTLVTCVHECCVTLVPESRIDSNTRTQHACHTPQVRRTQASTDRIIRYSILVETC